MPIHAIIILIIVGLILVFLLFGVVPVLPIAIKVHKMQLMRSERNPWGRQCSCVTNEEQVQMWDEGQAWFETVKDKCTEISITSDDGLKLAGQYFDFGGKKCVMILGGRCETVGYSYYYTKPYVELGYNVLLIDPRAHGWSEGKFNCVGCKEYKDVIKWIKLAHDTYGNEKVLLHGICIGSATSSYVVGSKECPEYVEGIVVDGMYRSFYDTFALHMKAEKRPVFPFCPIIMFVIAHYAGKNPMFFTPIKMMKKYKGSVLMIHSRLDAFSEPRRAIEIFESCPSPTKRLVWFDKGAHSHVRINNVDKYDATIKEYVTEVINRE